MHQRFVATVAASCAAAVGLVLLTSSTSLRATGQYETASAPGFLRELRASPVVENTFVGVPSDDPHTTAAATATFIVNYTGFTPQAQTAFQFAVDIWANRVVSSVPIVINAQFTALGPGVLGSAGPYIFLGNFPGTPLTNTWFPVAIANSRAGSDLRPSEPDIVANFSNAFTWYFGTDGNAPPGTYDMVSVVLHELGHGLGFLGSGTVSSGQGMWGFGTIYPTIWDRFVINGSGQSFIDTALFPNPSAALAGQLTSNNLFFNGTNARNANGGAAPKLYAPAVFSGGSSYSHLDEATYPAGNPNSLMTPQLGSAEAIHDPGTITLGMFVDMGIGTASVCSYALSAPSASFTAAGGTGSVTLTTGAACSWTVQNFASWVTITSATSGTGNATVTFTVAPQVSSVARSTTLVIGGQPFVISQAGVVCSLTVNPTADFVDAAGGTDIVNVTANASDCAWSVADNADWLSTSITAGAGTMSFSFTAAPNPTASQRVGVIMVGGIPVTITQRPVGPKPFLDLDGDGVGDALLYNSSTGQFSMRTGIAGGFSTLTGGTWATGWTIKKARFNDDTLDDLFFYNSSTGFWYKALNIGNGTFSFYGYRWAAGWTPLVGDWNGDGLSDVFIYNQTNGTWFRALTNPGALDFLYAAGAWAPGWSLYSGDFDGSGTDDLFIYNRNAPADPNSGKWFRVMTLGDGSFSYVPGDIRWANDWLPVAGDWNGDGSDDLFIYRNNGQWFKVFFLPTSASYVPGAWAGGWQIRVGPFNSDSLDDLHLYNATNGQSFTVLNDAAGHFTYYFTQWGAGWNVNLSDFNADGVADVLLYNATNGTGFQANTIMPGVWSYVAFSGWPTGMTVIAN